jgi:hypothetical protein
MKTVRSRHFSAVRGDLLPTTNLFEENLMKIKQFILVNLALMGLLTACTNDGGLVRTIQGSGNVVTETREVSGFTAVSLNGVGHLIIDQTGSESISITADDNILPTIETRVRGNKLIISIEDNTSFNNLTELTYHVTVQAIDTLELNGAGEVEVLNLEGQDWQTTLAGGGTITVSGKVDTQTAELNGAGAYNAEALQSQEATVRQNGAGMAIVQVSERLDVSIDGLGSVEYIGNPTVREEINGLGTVRQR